MSILEKHLSVRMPDNSLWHVPVEVIARNRAQHYAHEFGDDVEKSLAEDTIPLFTESSYDIEDWAANNMNWSDVLGQAFKVETEEEVDYQEGWINGDKEIVSP